MPNLNVRSMLMAFLAIFVLSACGKPVPVTAHPQYAAVEASKPTVAEPVAPATRPVKEQVACMLAGLDKDMPGKTLKQKLWLARHLHFGAGQTITVDGAPHIMQKGDTYWGACAGPTVEQQLAYQTALANYRLDRLNERTRDLQKANGVIANAQQTINAQDTMIANQAESQSNAIVRAWVFGILLVGAVIIGVALVLKSRRRRGGLGSRPAPQTFEPDNGPSDHTSRRRGPAPVGS